MFELIYDDDFLSDINSLDRATQKFIIDSLDEFANNFNSEYEKNLIKLKKIKLLQGDMQGFYRLKLRTYRVIYKKYKNKLVIYVVRVQHRNKVYKFMSDLVDKNIDN
jgi:mRNA interferase RelE/StbE